MGGQGTILTMYDALETLPRDRNEELSDRVQACIQPNEKLSIILITWFLNIKIHLKQRAFIQDHCCHIIANS